jgi:hypothetical protein
MNCGLKYIESIGFFSKRLADAKKIPGFPKAIFVGVALARVFRSHEFEQQRIRALLDLSIRIQFTRCRPLKFFLRLHKIRHQK